MKVVPVATGARKQQRCQHGIFAVQIRERAICVRVTRIREKVPKVFGDDAILVRVIHIAQSIKLHHYEALEGPAAKGEEREYVSWHLAIVEAEERRRHPAELKLYREEGVVVCVRV